jgi:hypothetical protein
MNQPTLQWERFQEDQTVQFNARSGLVMLEVSNFGGTEWKLRAYLPDQLEESFRIRINYLLVQIVDAQWPIADDAVNALLECEALTRAALKRIGGEVLGNELDAS